MKLSKGSKAMIGLAVVGVVALKVMTKPDATETEIASRVQLSQEEINNRKVEFEKRMKAEKELASGGALPASSSEPPKSSGSESGPGPSSQSVTSSSNSESLPINPPTEPYPVSAETTASAMSTVSLPAPPPSVAMPNVSSSGGSFMSTPMTEVMNISLPPPPPPAQSLSWIYMKSRGMVMRLALSGSLSVDEVQRLARLLKGSCVRIGEASETAEDDGCKRKLIVAEDLWAEAKKLKDSGFQNRQTLKLELACAQGDRSCLTTAENAETVFVLKEPAGDGTPNSLSMGSLASQMEFYRLRQVGRMVASSQARIEQSYVTLPIGSSDPAP
jgi:hypothetical protein